jgi:hypothetical protein
MREGFLGAEFLDADCFFLCLENGRKIVYFAKSLGRARGDCRGVPVSCRGQIGGEIEKHGWLK